MVKRVIGLVISLLLIEHSVGHKLNEILSSDLVLILGIIGLFYFGRALLKKKEVLKWLKV